MIAIRNGWWAALVLTAFVGCGKTEEAPPTAAPASVPSPESGPSPAIPPPAPPAEDVKTETPKAEMPREGDAPKVEAPAIEAPKIEAPKVDAPKAEDAPKGDAAAVTTLSVKQIAAIRTLPEAEQDAALKQLVCPVTDKPLGSMGKPFKVVAEGKTLFVCCEGCEEDVKADPKAIVAKLHLK